MAPEDSARPDSDLAEALEFQAATRAVLGIIGSSPADAQPVFAMIAESAARLCRAQFCHVYRYDGALIHFVAAHGLASEALKAIQSAYPMPPGRGSAAARAITAGALAQIPDIDADPDYTHGAVARAINFRSVAAVPMLKDGKPIGAIAVARTPTGLFPERQIELLRTFAEQAVIAVANARLFEEVRARAHDQAEMLEFQAATGEVLGIINRSMGDAQPVFDLIAESAARLCKAQFCHVYRYDGDLIHFVAAHGLNPGALKAIQDAYPMKPGRGSAAARAITSAALAEIEDIEADPDYTHGAAARAINFRAVVAVPMLKDGKPVGAIALARTAPGRFPQRQIDLLRTFAAQAVIAVENTRLLAEVQRQATQLAEWNATLETRVAEQVAQLGRMSKLTRFLSPKVSDLIMSGHADDPLKTRRVEITVVYVDLRGFTAFTETADPEEVMGVLRQYHAELGRAIMTYDGTIEHFAGDGVMIIFNDPVPVAEHELQAIRMTLAVRDAMKGLTQGWRKRGYALGFGAGIAGGYATIGTIGFEERLDYGAIGTVCNLAARLCGEAADGQILIAPRIFAKVEERIEAETVGELTLKGFARTVHAHNVLAVN